VWKKALVLLAVLVVFAGFRLAFLAWNEQVSDGVGDVEWSPLYASREQTALAPMTSQPVYGALQSAAAPTCDYTCVTCKGPTCETTCDQTCTTCQGPTCESTCRETCTTCQGPTCDSTCVGATCDYTCRETCQGPTCSSTCDGLTCEGTCDEYTCDKTCEYTCEGNTCQASCEGSTCIGAATCDGWTCEGTCSGYTCEETCAGSTCADAGTCEGLTCPIPTCTDRTCVGPTCAGFRTCDATCGICEPMTFFRTCAGPTCDGISCVDRTCDPWDCMVPTIEGLTCTHPTCDGPTCAGPTCEGETCYAVACEVWDFGDAPDSSVSPTYRFLTRLADDGARHVVDGVIYLGLRVDEEEDGQPHEEALGDDMSPWSLRDDEDGVWFPTSLIPGQQAILIVDASGEGFYQGWIDYDGSGDWEGNDPEEQLFPSPLELQIGFNWIAFEVPEDALAPATSFARFRFGTQAHLEDHGEARRGEVEDYEGVICQTYDVWIMTDDIVYERDGEVDLTFFVDTVSQIEIIRHAANGTSRVLWSGTVGSGRHSIRDYGGALHALIPGTETIEMIATSVQGECTTRVTTPYVVLEL
jgi:hypothetical protein